MRIHEFGSNRTQRVVGSVFDQRQLAAREYHANALIFKVELLFATYRTLPWYFAQIARMQVADHQRVRCVSENVTISAKHFNLVHFVAVVRLKVDLLICSYVAYDHLGEADVGHLEFALV